MGAIIGVVMDVPIGAVVVVTLLRMRWRWVVGVVVIA